MKKIVLLFVLALGLTFVTSAQRNATHQTKGVKFTKPYSITNVSGKATTDTIFPTTFYTACGVVDSLTAYLTTTGGYLSGNNEFGDLEKGTRVVYTGPGFVTGVMAGVIRIGSVGTSDISAKIYSKGTDSLPSMLLGTSDPVAITSLTIGSGAIVQFTFANPVPVNGDFFATVVLPTVTGDTLIVYSTSLTCTPADGGNYSMEKWSDGTFHYFNAADNWGINIDLFVGAIVNSSAAGITNNNAIENINVYSSNNNIIVKNNSNTVIKQVMVYNVLGQELGNYSVNNTGSTMFGTNLSSGNYIVKVISENKVGTYKLNVTR